MHEAIQEVSDNKFLAMAEKLFPLPSSGSYDRLHKHWRKSVTGLDKSKTNGYSLLGSFINTGPQWFKPGLYLACAWRGSVKNNKPYYALYALNDAGEVETLADIDPGKDWAIKLWPVVESYLAPPIPPADNAQPAFILSEADLVNAAFHTDEIKPCPLCGGGVLSSGERAANGNFKCSIYCAECSLSLNVCLDPSQGYEQARARAVSRWNQRATATA